MNTIKTKEEFETLISNNKSVVIDFFAEWCGPCKMLSPIIEEIANENPEIAFVKVDVDEAEELAQLFGIMSIPTVAYIKERRLVLRDVGFKSKAAIEANLKNIK